MNLHFRKLEIFLQQISMFFLLFKAFILRNIFLGFFLPEILLENIQINGCNKYQLPEVSSDLSRPGRRPRTPPPLGINGEEEEANIEGKTTNLVLMNS